MEVVLLIFYIISDKIRPNRTIQNYDPYYTHIALNINIITVCTFIVFFSINVSDHLSCKLMHKRHRKSKTTET